MWRQLVRELAVPLLVSMGVTAVTALVVLPPQELSLDDYKRMGQWRTYLSLAWDQLPAILGAGAFAISVVIQRKRTRQAEHDGPSS
jgi:hypothetical protein